MQEFGDLKTEEQVLTKPPLYLSHVQSVKIQPFKDVNYIHSPPHPQPTSVDRCALHPLSVDILSLR